MSAPAGPGSFSASASITGLTSAADISWSAADPGAGGGPVTYTLTCNNVTESTSAACGTATSGLTETVSSLNPGETYTVTVTATNLANLTSTATTAQFVPIGTGPPYLPNGAAVTLTRNTGTPQNIVIDGSSTITLPSALQSFRFDASAFIDPQGATYAAGTLNFRWTIVYAQADPYHDAGITGSDTPVLSIAKQALVFTTATDTANITLTIFDASTFGIVSYTFPITVTDGTIGISAYQTCQGNLPGTCTDPELLPAQPPGSFTVTASTTGLSSSAALNWTAAPDGGGGTESPVTYTIYCNDQTTQTLGVPCGNWTQSTSETISGLKPNDSYNFHVVATNNNGLATAEDSNTVTVQP
jgi:hypothetical protein